MTYHRRPTSEPVAMVRRTRRTNAARARRLPSMPHYGNAGYYPLRPTDTGPAPRPRARPSPTAVTQSTGISGYLLFAALVILVLVGGGTWLGSALTSTLSTKANTGSTYSLVGPPTVSADFINQVLVRYHSPAVGKGQVVYDDGVKYSIDPVFALAFFMHESSFGTTGEARASRSIGNLRCLGAGYEDLHSSCRNNFAWFSSWSDGIEAWYRLIKNGYVRGGINAYIGRDACPCATIAQIIPVYAPRSDNNDEAAYIAAVQQEVDTWRSGEVWVG